MEFIRSLLFNLGIVALAWGAAITQNPLAVNLLYFWAWFVIILSPFPITFASIEKLKKEIPPSAWRRTVPQWVDSLFDLAVIVPAAALGWWAPAIAAVLATLVTSLFYSADKDNRESAAEGTA